MAAVLEATFPPHRAFGGTRRNGAVAELASADGSRGGRGGRRDNAVSF
jgi:hypothetical protein